MIAYLLIALVIAGIFHSVSAYTIDEKNAIFKEFQKTGGTGSSTDNVFAKCAKVDNTNDSKIGDACIDFIAHYNDHMKQLINQTRSDMIEILVNN